MQKILITGNLGYVGPLVVKTLNSPVSPQTSIVGMDIGWFLTNNKLFLGENCLDGVELQMMKDISHITPADLHDVCCVVHLAAVSNDPMGNEFAEITHRVNVLGTQRLLDLCADCGVKRFIAASSCSLYGASANEDRTEDDELDPLTNYAKSKLFLEEYMKRTAEISDLECISLRFATACGASPNIRLDLVVNDFVSSALTRGKISVRSDGSPWRPLIDVEDMAKAIRFFVDFDIGVDKFFCVNVGANKNNFTIKQIAELVREQIPTCLVEILNETKGDKRSYRVNFDKYESVYKEPLKSIDQSICEIIDYLTGKPLENIKESPLIRLNALRKLMVEGLMG